jgi:hypothetical protein
VTLGRPPAAWPNLPQLPPLDEAPQTTDPAPAESAAPQPQQPRESRPEDVGLRILGDLLQRSGSQQKRDDSR